MVRESSWCWASWPCCFPNSCFASPPPPAYYASRRSRWDVSERSKTVNERRIWLTDDVIDFSGQNNNYLLPSKQSSYWEGGGTYYWTCFHSPWQVHEDRVLPPGARPVWWLHGREDTALTQVNEGTLCSLLSTISRLALGLPKVLLPFYHLLETDDGKTLTHPKLHDFYIQAKFWWWGSRAHWGARFVKLTDISHFLLWQRVGEGWLEVKMFGFWLIPLVAARLQ